MITGTVATGAAADGPYVVTITATDDQDNSTGQQFLWTVTVEEVALTVTNPGSQSDDEWEYVELPIEVSRPELWLTFAASGLPIGLLIDPLTGVISGTIDGTAADLSDGEYTVVVYANDGQGTTASTTFTWTVNDVNRAPWLAPPSNRYNRVADVVSLQLEGGDWDIGQTVTYSAMGLPDGLSVNAVTGLISGTITAAPDDYPVTVTVSDGALTTDQVFTWEVSSGSYAPQVTLAINATTTHTDDVIIWGSPAISVLVTLENAGPGLHTIELSVPTGQASFDVPTFQLANGSSMLVLLTALQLSVEEDDVLLLAKADGKDAGDAKMTIMEVETFPEHIRAPNTPERMKDRIPPTSITTFDVKFSVKLEKSGAGVVFRVLNQSDDNGRAVFVTSKGDEFPAGIIMSDVREFKLRLKGKTQTKPTDDGKGGNAGQLILRAFINGNEDQKKDSAGFSVAAIPVTVEMKKPVRVIGEPIEEFMGLKKFVWGVAYRHGVISDSGFPNDLDQVEMCEVIEIKEATGIGKAWAARFDSQKTPDPVADFLDLCPMGCDYHAVFYTEADYAFAAKKLKDELSKQKAGKLLVHQSFYFVDSRTGTSSAPSQRLFIPNSGFAVEYIFESGRDWFLTIRKTGLQHGEVKAGGIAAGDVEEKPVPLP